MLFCDKLIKLRRERGLSQEQLANLLDVSRQAVSKWEAGKSMPELEKLISLSHILGVSLDYLVKENYDDLDKTASPPSDNTAVIEKLNEINGHMKRMTGYEYKSKTKVFGLPLVHIKLSNNMGPASVAKGIIAIGNIAIGVLALGGLSIGIFSIGGLSLALIFALGGFSLAPIALGGISIGLLASGGIALGIYAIGGISAATELAVGGIATGRVAIGSIANGEYILLMENATNEHIRQFLLLHYPSVGSLLFKLVLLL